MSKNFKVYKFRREDREQKMLRTLYRALIIQNGRIKKKHARHVLSSYKITKHEIDNFLRKMHRLKFISVLNGCVILNYNELTFPLIEKLRDEISSEKKSSVR